MTPSVHYGRADVIRALTEVGVRPGSVVFSHSSVAMLGVPECGLDQAAIAEMFLSAFQEATGGTGTWILPAYTYSYTKDERFDPDDDAADPGHGAPAQCAVAPSGRAPFT